MLPEGERQEEWVSSSVTLCPLSGLTQFVDVRHQSAPGLQILSSEAIHGKQDNRRQVKPEQGNQKLHPPSWYYLSFSTLENT